jgi:hypothetical protein
MTNTASIATTTKGLELSSLSSSSLRLFAYEYGVCGERQFIVSTYADFWDKYINMEKKARHYYEVICEGLPCHLYFDLEFKRAFNPGVDDERIMTVFVKYLIKALDNAYGITITNSDIIHLESSTEAKFSRHLIVKMPDGSAFEDSVNMGSFIRKLVMDMQRDRAEDPSLECLFIQTSELAPPSEPGSAPVSTQPSPSSPLPSSTSSSPEPSLSPPTTTTFIDTGVYTRNRCFRLFLSSKWYFQ